MLPFDFNEARGLYVLDDAGEPQVETNVARWEAWFADGSRRVVAKTQVGNDEVSTVFLGVDNGDVPPRWWETMVFPACMLRWRCSGSREQAIAQHEMVVAEFLKLTKGERRDR